MRNIKNEEELILKPAEKGQILLEARHISKNFYGVQALVDANIQLRAGEVHALVGGNASGKSTLVRVLCGAFHQSGGEVLVQGKPVWFRDPSEARKLGIGTVMQNLGLFDGLNAVDNLFSGQEICHRRPFGQLLDKKRMRKQASVEFDRLGIQIPSLKEHIRAFSGGQRQSIAFARALMGGSDILLLDEPTAALGVKETANVMELIRRCREGNAAILIISHSMEDVLDIADRITVIRHGVTISTFERRDLNRRDIIGLITGDITPEEVVLPKIYDCCGTEDILYPRYRDFQGIARELGLEVTWSEGPGVHNWDYWASELTKFIDWLPLKHRNFWAKYYQSIGSPLAPPRR